jgi:Holliday junction DNA helicase RuvA
MIARLSGRLIEKSPSRIIVDVAGVGYAVHVPLSTFYGLGEPGSEVLLRIHTHVREDAISLFGFATTLELDLFERLIGINGIGPKLALAVLSGIDPSELVRAVAGQDVARLTRIPGVGKKTAERIGLELKDRLPHAASMAGALSDASASRRDDLLSALTNLGYKGPVAEKAIDGAISSAPGATFEQVLRDILRQMVR